MYVFGPASENNHFNQNFTASKTNTYVTVSTKTVLIGTFSNMRKTDLKYLSCCGSVVLNFSHTRFTV